ncbi:peptidylprolyl isomerase [Thioalkalivibrio sulfidiphilus]|uniref:peptidylprolyl isomerase n=1 Tax=Thioalkalivibrio sulfidiphilus TaxID=1033854 RepID=UPI000371B5CF|nr:peptidylprolyl isomerase [Thioalkalivibrio sulfidiphilus]
MKLRIHHILGTGLLAAALITGCGRGEAPQAQINGEAIAVVNGVAISEADFQDFLNLQRMTRPGESLLPDEVLDEMINMELLRQAALQQGLDKDPDIQRQVERARTNLMVGALIDRRLDQEYTEEQLRAEYDRQIQAIERTEYKARHILLDSEADAREVIVALEAGGDFQALAREHSTGPSGPMGGDLGWFTLDAMVPAFSQAVQAMEKGSYSSEPVQTEFGWHVILLEDTRSSEPPPFEAVRDRVAQILDNRALQDYIGDLRAAAKIEVK